MARKHLRRKKPGEPSQRLGPGAPGLYTHTDRENGPGDNGQSKPQRRRPGDEEPWALPVKAGIIVLVVLVCATLGVLALSGVRDDKIERYRVPKVETPAPKAPPVAWTLPTGWTELNRPRTELRYATIRMGSTEQPLELTVTNFGGSVEDNINRWRDEQLSLPRLSAQEIPGVTRVMKVNGATVFTVDMTGKAPSGDRRSLRLLAAIVPVGNNLNWFFKLMGPPAAVGEEVKAFDAFVQSLRFSDGK